jgi:hypothetical protein
VKTTRSVLCPIRTVSPQLYLREIIEHCLAIGHLFTVFANGVPTKLCHNSDTKKNSILVVYASRLRLACTIDPGERPKKQ